LTPAISPYSVGGLALVRVSLMATVVRGEKVLGRVAGSLP
jgi:hypothetical protein